MSVSKFKTLLVASVIGCSGFASQSYAQISVEDRDAGVLLERIEENTKKENEAADKFRKEDTSEHYKSQIEHYDREIERLNALITSLGYFSVDGENDPEEVTKDNEILSMVLEKSDGARDAVQEAAEGKSTQFGISVGEFNGSGLGAGFTDGLGDGSAAGPADFLAEFGLSSPDALYEENPQSQKSLARKYNSLYLANTVAGEANLGRTTRLEVYDELITKALEAKDVQTAMRVQNAILLENGKNLALLIDLETANLNAQSISILESVERDNAPGYLFGVGSGSFLGDAAFLALVEAVN